MQKDVRIEISEFLGYCDLNGAEILDHPRVEKLEMLITTLNKSTNAGIDLVANAVYERLLEILKIVNPESSLLNEVWSEDEEGADLSSELNKYLITHPMMSINTCKSFTCKEFTDFVKKLPQNTKFEGHGSVKLNGHAGRCMYSYGYFEDGTSRGRHSAGRSLKRHFEYVLERNSLINIESFADIDVVEIRGEFVCPISKYKSVKGANGQPMVSAFTAVTSLVRDSVSDEELENLDFVAYKIIADGIEFQTKDAEYSYLEELGFKTPMSWVIPDLSAENILEEIQGIIEDCERDTSPDDYSNTPGYEYYSDGIVFEVNSRDLFRSMGKINDKYNYGNVALKVGVWAQDTYSGYIQTILWSRGKNKLSPIAIVAEDIDMAHIDYELDEDEDIDDLEKVDYIRDIKQLLNYKELGVITAGGNRVRRIPLYEPANMLILDAYPGSPIHFKFGGEAGVVPCFPDGTILKGAILKKMLDEEDSDEIDFEPSNIFGESDRDCTVILSNGEVFRG